ncbi:hypothetical protein [Streptomyces sp. NPDC056337]|uniref:hypothetical protein n=1 Tax=Streptomyces sp. NPDC056337 TaxID=3345787 RepID=UPI0035DA897C
MALVSEHLPGLRDSTSHAVNLSVWGDHGPVVVRWAYGAHALPITVRVGATMPLLTSTMGGAFLAHLLAQLTEPVLCGQLKTETLDAATRERVDRIRGPAGGRGHHRRRGQFRHHLGRGSRVHRR